MSFSAEMKDFLNAYKTGQSINASRTTQDYQSAQQDALQKKTTRENDPDTLELQDKQARANLAKTQDSLATGAAQRAHLGATTAYTAALAKRLAQDPAAQGSGLMPPGAITPGGSAQPSPGALPIGPSTMDTEAYADGGLVPDEADEGAPDNEASESGPAVPINTPTDVSARARTTAGIQGVVAPELVQDAVKAGMTWGANAYGLTGTGAVRSPSQTAQAKLLAQGHGGLTPQEMEAAKKAVDPEGKLTESQRNMAALGSVYQFWANKGDNEKASKVAFQMLQHYRNASSRYAAIAAHAAQGGNLDLATKAAMRAYANVPDGNDLEIYHNPDDGSLRYHVTGPNGEDVDKGLATPQQLAASAMGLASGGFDKALLSAAGAQEATTKGGAVGKPQSASDRAKEGELPTGPINAMKDAWQAKNPDAKPDEEMWQQAHDVAQHILQQNRNATAGEAARAAHLLINPGKTDPEKPDFKVIAGEEGQPHTVVFGNGSKFKLDDDQLGTIMNSRAARIKQATDKINADMEAQDQPSRMAQAIEGAKQIGGAVASDAGKFGQEVRGAIPDELIARGGSAIDSVKRAATDAAAVLTDPNINFGTLSTAYKKKVIDAANTIKSALSGGGAVPVDDNGGPQP